MNLPFSIAVAVALVFSVAASAQEPPAPLTLEAVREKLAGTRTARSADGLTTVAVPAALSGSDALTLCRFAGDVRARLSTLIDVPLDGEDYATDIIVRDLPDGGEPFVACSVAESGLRRIRVVIVGVDKVQPVSVTVALCGGFLRANAIAAGWGRRNGEFALVDGGTAPYPAWMRLGAARLLDQSARQDDAERAIARLERGDIPPIATLLAAEGSPADADPALAAQLVAWLLDDSPRNVRFRAVRDCALKSGAWDPAAAFALAAETEDPAAADAAWRAWLDRRKWSILTPGSSHPAFVRRLRGLLELYPPPPRPAPAASAETQTTNAAAAVSGEAPEIAPQPEILAKIPASAFEMCGGVITPAAVFLHAEEKWAPHAAMALSGRIQRLAAGHGDDVLAVAHAYGQFFAAVHAHEPRRELARRLALADDLLGIIEGGDVTPNAPLPADQDPSPTN